MSIEAMSRRISTIERCWKDASDSGRAGYVDELSTISTGLRGVTGIDAERAEWLGHRLTRLVRSIKAAPH